MGFSPTNILRPGVKVYRALLTQTATNAPVATVLENTLGGTVVWTRTNEGLYVATLAGAFTASKTGLNAPATTPTSGTWSGITGVLGFSRTGNDTLRLITLVNDSGALFQTDDILQGAFVEILVYP